MWSMFVIVLLNFTEDSRKKAQKAQNVLKIMAAKRRKKRKKILKEAGYE